jgi:hypothetical protein
MRQQFLERTNRLYSLIVKGPHKKQLVQQLLYCCVSIRCHSKDFTQPLSSSGKEYIQSNIGIYEIHCRDVLRCHDMHTKFHKDWFKYS